MQGHDVDKLKDMLGGLPDPGMNMIALLQQVQNLLGYIPDWAVDELAVWTGRPAADIYGVITFYARFRLEPVGRHTIRVCDGTACHVKGSGQLIHLLREMLELEKGQSTTADRLFTLETVSCLGACGLAPVLVVDEDVYGQVVRERIPEILERYRKEAQGGRADE